MQLSQSQIAFQKANYIIKVFVKQDETNIEFLRQYLKEYGLTYQFRSVVLTLECIISLFLIITIESGVLQNIRKKMILKQQKQ